MERIKQALDFFRNVKDVRDFLYERDYERNYFLEYCFLDEYGDPDCSRLLRLNLDIYAKRIVKEIDGEYLDVDAKIDGIEFYENGECVEYTNDKNIFKDAENIFKNDIEYLVGLFVDDFFENNREFYYWEID